MPDTAHDNSKARSRIVEDLLVTDGSAIGCALAILKAIGINDTPALNRVLDGGSFDGYDRDAHALNLSIETSAGYPDRIARLADGSVLITDTIEGLSVGGVYNDFVLIGEGPADTSTIGDKVAEIAAATNGAAEPEPAGAPGEAKPEAEAPALRDETSAS